jgi:hypothetical protein
VLAVICVQSLYTTWRDEMLMIKRLRELNMTSMSPNKYLNGHGDGRNGKMPGAIDGVENMAYYSSGDPMNGGVLIEAGVPKIPR